MGEEEVTDATVVDETTEQPAPPDVVIVVKTKDADGSIKTEVVTQGNIELTEVQTILELGVQGWRRQIGLSR